MNEADIAAFLKKLSSSKSLKETRKESFFSELHSLLASGLDFSHAFRLLIDGENDDNFRTVLDRLYADVVAGSSLWQALEGCGRFSALDCGVVRIGEETGRLSDSLAFLVDYYREFGFEVVSGEYLDGGIPHYKMLLRN